MSGNEADLYTKYRGELKGHASLVGHGGSYIDVIGGPISSQEIIRMAESLT